MTKAGRHTPYASEAKATSADSARPQTCVTTCKGTEEGPSTVVPTIYGPTPEISGR